MAELQYATTVCPEFYSSYIFLVTVSQLLKPPETCSDCSVLACCVSTLSATVPKGRSPHQRREGRFGQEPVS